MVVDDLWLYQYHQREYDGVIRTVFETISLVEEKQWEIVGLQPYAEELKGQLEDLPKYNPHSNEKFMREARNNNVLLDSLLDFLLFSVPLTLVMEFLLYRLFFLTFDYEASKYLRPYSFKLILLELLVQNNIEYFSFLGCRAVHVLFSYSIASKCWNGFAILFIFAVVFCVFCSYRPLLKLLRQTGPLLPLKHVPIQDILHPHDPHLRRQTLPQGYCACSVV